MKRRLNVKSLHIPQSLQHHQALLLMLSLSLVTGTTQSSGGLLPQRCRVSQQCRPFGSQRKSDYKVGQNAEIICQNPEIPVGGCLRFFHQNWQKITSDQWVSTIKEGYKLEFLEKPKFTGVRPTVVQSKDQELILKEIETLLQKDAIEKVPIHNCQEDFYSTFFLVPKKNGLMRPVLNLRPLNRYLAKKHFRMDTLTKVINMVRPKDWGFTIDLADAYLHIPLFSKHRKYLRFLFQRPMLSVKGNVFWSNLGTKSVDQTSVGSSSLSTDTEHQTRSKSTQTSSFERSKSVPQSYGLPGLNDKCKKSSLVPSQSFVYLGALFHLHLGLVMPTEERFVKIQLAIKSLLNRQAKAQDFLHLLGLMASCIELVPNARLYMRPIQLYLLCFWKPSTCSVDMSVPITQHLVSHLSWWKQKANILKGRQLQMLRNTCTGVTWGTNSYKVIGQQNNRNGISICWNWKQLF